MTFASCCVSNAEYCEFLNACARLDDSHHLWNPLMSEHFFGGIVKESETNSSIHHASLSIHHYSVRPGYEKKPVTYVSWESAARYCNWLSFGKPTDGVSVLGTTEGDATYGVYDTRVFGTPEFVRGTMPVRRNTDKVYFLPTADEWRAAAFAGGDKGEPIVYDGRWMRKAPHLADVDDGVTNRLGLVNMLGNVAEWVETRRGAFFMALGGSVIRGKYSLEKGFSEGDECNKPIGTFGIRVAHADHPIILPRPAVAGRSVPARRIPESTNVSLSGECGPQGTAVPTGSAWCKIGYPGNARDPLYRVGRVDYEFEMARYPVTNEDWCKFMNAVGYEKSLSLGLYNPDMSTGVCGGIDCTNEDKSTLQLQLSTSTCFHPKPGWSRRPVVYISYLDAMRYCNWLQTGDTERGAYDVMTPNYHRLPGAKYFIPTDDEWCKAAYFDPTKFGVRKYWDYPCRTSDEPPNDPKLSHACNYLTGEHLGEKGPYYLAEVDAYPTSDTFFGCRQMAGNVWEWVEPVDAGCLNLRGTSFGYTDYGMGIWNRDCAGYADELNVFGARIVRAVEGAKVAKPRCKRRIKDWLQDKLV